MGFILGIFIILMVFITAGVIGWYLWTATRRKGKIIEAYVYTLSEGSRKPEITD